MFPYYMQRKWDDGDFFEIFMMIEVFQRRVLFLFSGTRILFEKR